MKWFVGLWVEKRSCYQQRKLFGQKQLKFEHDAPKAPLVPPTHVFYSANCGYDKDGFNEYGFSSMTSRTLLRISSIS